MPPPSYREQDRMTPTFGYLFDRTAKEGVEYDVDPEQIHHDRQRRVDQATAEFSIPKTEEVFSYFEREDGAASEDILYPEEMDEPLLQTYAGRPSEDPKYNTLPIFNDSGNPFSVQAQEDPQPEEELDMNEEVEGEWDVAEDDEGDIPGFSPFQAQEDRDGPIEEDMSDAVFADEYDEEEFDGKPVSGEGDGKAATSRPQSPSATTFSPSGAGFVMPDLNADDEEFEPPENRTDSRSRRKEPQDSKPRAEAVPEDEDVSDKEIESLFAPRQRKQPVSEEAQRPKKDARPEGSEPERPNRRRSDAEKKRAPLPSGRPAGDNSPVFLQETPELVTFSSLEEDPRRNSPRISALDGLTRYLNDDDADVSPKFYEDDDFEILSDEMPVENDSMEMNREPADEEERGDLPPLPSSLLFAGVSQRPKTQEEFNSLKAHAFHSDLGFRKYHITIVNLFDALDVERKLYVKYYPRRQNPVAKAQPGSDAPKKRVRSPEGERGEAGGTVWQKLRLPFAGAKENARPANEKQSAPFSDSGEQENGVEFTNPEDASKIRTELRRDIKKSGRDFYWTGLLALLSLFFTAAEPLGISLPNVMRVSGGTTFFLILNTLFLMGAILLNFDSVVESVKRLVVLEFDSDSAVSLVSLFCLLQNLILFTGIQKLADGSLHLYSGMACLGLALQAGGRLLMHKRVLQNFKFVASSKPKKVIRLIPDAEYSRQMAGETTNGEPIVAYQARTKFLSGFMRLSYVVDPSERTTQTLTPFLLLAGAVIGLIAGIAQKNALTGFSAAAAALSVSMPVINMLAINLPLYQATKGLLKEGVLLTSSASLEEYSEVNSVMLDATELFPEGSVVLHGVKKFCEQTVEEVMADAAALVCSVKGPLQEMFAKNMGEAVDLSRVQGAVEYTDRLGFSGFMEGQPVFAGTADWIRRQGIELPPREIAQKHMAKGRQLLYFAKGDKLLAFFALSHVPDPSILQAIARYEQTGGGFVVRTTDPFVTERSVSDWFGVGNRSVRVLSSEMGGRYGEILEGTEMRSPAFLATTGRTTSFFRAISVCVRAKLNVTLIMVLQAVSLILGALIVAGFSIFAGVAGLNMVFMLVYLLFWSLIILALPFFRKF